MTKNSDSDEDSLLTKIGVSDGNVVVLFGQKINWMSLTPVSAREFAAGIIEAADVAAAHHKLN